MRHAFLNRPSPAMVVALLALFVALGGSGYAAVTINGKNISKNSIAGPKLQNNTITAKKIRNRTLTGRKVKRNSLTGSEIRESSLGTVPKATNSTLLGGRAADTFLPVGGTAADSQKLGGLAPSSWVRRECNQNSGQIKGFAGVDGSATFSSTFTDVTGYNCSDQSVEARRVGMGRYEVRFNGSPVTRAVATAMVTSLTAVMVSIRNLGPGLFEVEIINPLPAPGAFEDDPFAMIAP